MGKKNLGAILALYPCPVVVVGAMVNDKPTWTLVAHAGTVAHSHLMVSLVQAHYINQGIRENGKLSVNIVDASWLKEADRIAHVYADSDLSLAEHYVEQAAPIRMELGDFPQAEEAVQSGIDLMGEIPREKVKYKPIAYEDYDFTILSVKDRRIEKIRIEKVEREEDPDE